MLWENMRKMESKMFKSKRSGSCHFSSLRGISPQAKSLKPLVASPELWGIRRKSSACQRGTPLSLFAGVRFCAFLHQKSRAWEFSFVSFICHKEYWALWSFRSVAVLHFSISPAPLIHGSERCCWMEMIMKTLQATCSLA
jgi:hypothetical protein